MAAKKSKQYPYQWADGSWHSVPQTRPGPAKGNPSQPGLLPPPPVGTYDPAIDYNAGASQRGYGNTQDDAATAYEQGQEDYGVASRNLEGNWDRAVADLNQQIGDVQRQYGILGHQQAGQAAQHGITSAGLLQLSAQKRAANQAHDIAPLQQGINRANQDYLANKQSLDLTNARTFGGYGGNTLLDPVTNQPVFGTLQTNLTRTGVENEKFQTASAAQRVFQAAANNYVAPPPPPPPPVGGHTTLLDFLMRRRPGAPAKGVSYAAPAKGISY